jgi:lipoprotein-releasing system ATP-binding protein
MNELRAEGVVQRFPMGDRQIEVLRGVDLSIRSGESIAIHGVSGVGKSTLLYILGGLERPTEGRVLYDERDLYAMDGPEIAHFRNRHLGFVFQFHHLLPEFTAEENVMMPCLIAGWPRPRARARALEMIESVGLQERRQHRPGKLSGGERQRIAIARALAPTPRLLLADEPTGNLDPETADEVMEVLLRLNEETGAALVLVTHNPKLAGLVQKRCSLVNGKVES